VPAHHLEDNEMSSEIWFENHGTRLFAVGSGRGRPIILLHGGLANHQSCRLYAASLAERFRLITPDLRGSGRSIDPRPLDWDLLADDVAALIRYLALGRAVVGGISFGAGVAVRTALRHPRATAALVVLHPAFGGADVGLTPAQHAAMQAMDAAGSRAVADGIEVLYPLFDTLPPAVRERARAVVATYDPASVATTTRFLRSGGQPFAAGADLASISVPTLLVPGVDPTHPVEVADVYRRHLPRCAVRTVDPTGFAAAIADFIDRELT
jgi:pimeloyl-ACP methyl ester carboxylesterase